MPGVMLTALLSMILANSINLTEIAIIGSASFLLIFFVVNLASYKLHYKINANKNIVLAACFVSLLALVTLIIHTFSKNPKAIIIFLTFIVFSFLFELVYGKIVRKHFFHRSY